MPKLLDRFTNILYIQIWEHRIRITRFPDGEVFERTPPTTLNPFSHPRTVLSDFAHAEAFMKQCITETNDYRLAKTSPIVVMQPMEKIDGGLTAIERRAFLELGYAAGAREVHVHTGQALNRITRETLDTLEQDPERPVPTHFSLRKLLLPAVFIIYLLLQFKDRW